MVFGQGTGRLGNRSGHTGWPRAAGLGGQAEIGNAKGSTPSAPALRRARPASDSLQPESTRSSTSRTGALRPGSAVATADATVKASWSARTRWALFPREAVSVGAAE